MDFTVSNWYKTIQNRLNNKNIQYCKTYSKFDGRIRFIIDIGNDKCVYLYYDSDTYIAGVGFFIGAIIRHHSFNEACDMALNDCIRHRQYNGINIHSGKIAELSEGPKDKFGNPTWWTIEGILDGPIDINGNKV